MTSVKLVVIYGAPAVGKLTTARALAALTGFKLLHNRKRWSKRRTSGESPRRTCAAARRIAAHFSLPMVS
jgi:adenylate kinase family enzyme